MLFLAAAPIYLVLFSRIAARKDDQATRRRLTITVLTAMTGALALGYVAIWFAGNRVVQIMFGAGFAGAVPILRVTWITMSMLVLEAVATFVLLGEDRTRGSSLFVIPVLTLVALLAWRHKSAMEVALCSLGSVLVGAIVVGALIWFGRDQPTRRQTVVAQNPQL
jgi:O-antigen/teichoic acid export membrane protein